MEILDQPKLEFRGIDIVKVDFQAKEPVSAEHVKIPVNATISPKVFYPPDRPKEFLIFMEVTINHPSTFDLTILSIGYFGLSSDVTTEFKDSVVNCNAPAIMFPFIRAFITTLTSNLGRVTGAILLPPKMFSGKLEELSSEEIDVNEMEK